MAAGDPYFRTSGNPNDLGSLPQALRDHSDLANVALMAEADVLAHFTTDRLEWTSERSDPSWQEAVTLDEGTAVERYVLLRGYHVDPTLAPTAFAAAFRRAIATVIRWRVAQDEKKPNVTSEASGSKTSRSYRADAEHRLPPGFGLSLEPFRIRRDLGGLV